MRNSCARFFLTVIATEVEFLERVERGGIDTCMRKAKFQPQPAVPPKPAEPIEVDEPGVIKQDAIAHEEFGKVVGHLRALRVLAPCDGICIALYAAAYARWVRAIEWIREHGDIMSTPSGYQQIHPMATERDSAEKSMLKLLTEMFLTPASRARYKIVMPKETTVSKLAQLIGDGNQWDGMIN
jgi:P27 family predicted phage terminase small subunit